MSSSLVHQAEQALLDSDYDQSLLLLDCFFLEAPPPSQFTIRAHCCYASCLYKHLTTVYNPHVDLQATLTLCIDHITSSVTILQEFPLFRATLLVSTCQCLIEIVQNFLEEPLFPVLSTCLNNLCRVISSWMTSSQSEELKDCGLIVADVGENVNVFSQIVFYCCVSSDSLDSEIISLMQKLKAYDGLNTEFFKIFDFYLNKKGGSKGQSKKPKSPPVKSSSDSAQQFKIFETDDGLDSFLKNLNITVFEVWNEFLKNQTVNSLLNSSHSLKLHLFEESFLLLSEHLNSEKLNILDPEQCFYLSKFLFHLSFLQKFHSNKRLLFIIFFGHLILKISKSFNSRCLSQISIDFLTLFSKPDNILKFSKYFLDSTITVNQSKNSELSTCLLLAFVNIFCSSPHITSHFKNHSLLIDLFTTMYDLLPFVMGFSHFKAVFCRVFGVFLQEWSSQHSSATLLQWSRLFFQSQGISDLGSKLVVIDHFVSKQEDGIGLPPLSISEDLLNSDLFQEIRSFSLKLKEFSSGNVVNLKSHPVNYLSILNFNYVLDNIEISKETHYSENVLVYLVKETAVYW
ncbi:hypothetical protein GEMRC1_009532 [Eukaryota sp. GEM-RC1]